MVRVGIINVTGYAGAELARLLYNHPEARLVSVSGRSAAGKPLAEVFPHLPSSPPPPPPRPDAVAPLVRAGVPVVDISADFRLKDPAEYAQWYGVEHSAPDLLPSAVYGLTELNREAVKGPKLIANPGCYPTGALLALAPAVKAGIIAPDVISDSKSRISPAGPPPPPPLVPIPRGTPSPCSAPLLPGALPPGEAAKEAVREVYRGFYQGEP